MIKLIILVLLLQGCSLHYMSEKGVKAKAEDISLKGATLEDTNAYFHSTVDLWIPFRPKNYKEKR